MRLISIAPSVRGLRRCAGSVMDCVSTKVAIVLF